jgi:hypothetical protein
VLQDFIPDPNALPKMVEPGGEFPSRPRLRGWVCEMNPRRHVEVIGWQLRPVKDCSVPGCDGVMIHTSRARYNSPATTPRLPSKTYQRVGAIAGFLCMKNEGHVELDQEQR